MTGILLKWMDETDCSEPPLWPLHAIRPWLKSLPQRASPLRFSKRTRGDVWRFLWQWLIYEGRSQLSLILCEETEPHREDKVFCRCKRKARTMHSPPVEG
ncbi:hypothetical protein OJAV_G00231690 [Oryzias javanicus]|uniref:Uncharacterized protein n=1 Tax=Oryzias javanicus TaxID=123683 RepID=A0A437BZV2_ORYJA|nr:hypothetical protein OJAV_G00231690 [Oryzias javanicus]